MKAMISTLSLALSLAATAPVVAQTAAPAATAPAAAPTAADADAFIAAAEKDLFDYTVEASQVNWVNYNFITEDTDAMAARNADSQNGEISASSTLLIGQVRPQPSTASARPTMPWAVVTEGIRGTLRSRDRITF